jgi:hypothetical protein
MWSRPWFQSWHLRVIFLALCLFAAPAGGAEPASFPPALTDYPAATGGSLLNVLAQRMRQEPFNLIATIVFFLAIVHTFLAPKFARLSHTIEQKHRQKVAQNRGRFLPGA